MGFRMKNFNIMGVSLKNLIFRWGRGGGVGSRKTNIGGVASKGGGLGESPEGVVFLRGVDTLMHTMVAAFFRKKSHFWEKSPKIPPI